MGIHFGVDYYPEHWPTERWETDAGLMQEMGVQVVRMAEFSWFKKWLFVINHTDGERSYQIADSYRMLEGEAAGWFSPTPATALDSPCRRRRAHMS